MSNPRQAGTRSSTVRRRIAAVTLAATASAGLMTSAAGTAQAAEWTYIAAYRYLQDCKDTGNQYVHQLIASTYKCTGTYATGYSLFIKYRIA